jgi:hypothetical protein
MLTRLIMPCSRIASAGIRHAHALLSFPLIETLRDSVVRLLALDPPTLLPRWFGLVVAEQCVGSSILTEQMHMKIYNKITEKLVSAGMHADVDTGSCWSIGRRSGAERRLRDPRRNPGPGLSSGRTGSSERAAPATYPRALARENAWGPSTAALVSSVDGLGESSALGGSRALTQWKMRAGPDISPGLEVGVSVEENE